MMATISPSPTVKRHAFEGIVAAAVAGDDVARREEESCSWLLPLPLREGVGGRGRAARTLDPSPQPPPSRGGGGCFLRVHHRPAADPPWMKLRRVAQRLPLPLREGVGGGVARHGPSTPPPPPPSRGGGDLVSCEFATGRAGRPALDETARVAQRAPPPLEGGGWGEGSRGTDPRPLPPTPSLKGRGRLVSCELATGRWPTRPG